MDYSKDILVKVLKEHGDKDTLFYNEMVKFLNVGGWSGLLSALSSNVFLTYPRILFLNGALTYSVALSSAPIANLMYAIGLASGNYTVPWSLTFVPSSLNAPAQTCVFINDGLQFGNSWTTYSSLSVDSASGEFPNFLSGQNIMANGFSSRFAYNNVSGSNTQISSVNNGITFNSTSTITVRELIQGKIEIGCNGIFATFNMFTLSFLGSSFRQISIGYFYSSSSVTMIPLYTMIA